MPLPASNLTANLLLLNMILSGAAAFILFRYALVERFPFSLSFWRRPSSWVAFAYGLLTWAAVNNSPPSTSMLVWIGLLPSNGLCLAAALALVRRSSTVAPASAAGTNPAVSHFCDRLGTGFPLFDPIVSTISVAAVGFAAFRVTRKFFRLSPRDDFAPRPTTRACTACILGTVVAPSVASDPGLGCRCLKSCCLHR